MCSRLVCTHWIMYRRSSLILCECWCLWMCVSMCVCGRKSLAFGYVVVETVWCTALHTGRQQAADSPNTYNNGKMCTEARYDVLSYCDIMYIFKDIIYLIGRVYIWPESFHMWNFFIFEPLTIISMHSHVIEDRQKHIFPTIRQLSNFYL